MGYERSATGRIAEEGVSCCLRIDVQKNVVGSARLPGQKECC